MSVYSIALVLYLIMDPIGNIGSFREQLKRYEGAKKRWVILREMSFALLAMLLFAMIGEYLFLLLNISEAAVRLSSGLILFLCAIQILFPTVDSARSSLPDGEPYAIPLAIPLTAGPALLATVMLYSHLEERTTVMILSVVIAWLFALFTHLIGDTLYRLVGSGGLIAMERLMGMILVLLAIQRFMEGVKLFMAVGAVLHP